MLIGWSYLLFEGGAYEISHMWSVSKVEHTVSLSGGASSDSRGVTSGSTTFTITSGCASFPWGPISCGLVWGEAYQGSLHSKSGRVADPQTLDQLVHLAIPSCAKYIVDRFAQRTAWRYGHGKYPHNHQCRYAELTTCEMRRTDGP
jgi:hypothetical protein